MGLPYELSLLSTLFLCVSPPAVKRGCPIPQGTLSHVWEHLWCSQLGVPLASKGLGSGRLLSTHRAQHGPTESTSWLPCQQCHVGDPTLEKAIVVTFFLWLRPWAL